MTTLVDELIDFLFDGQPHVLAAPMEACLASSRRYVSFVSTFRDKIRKKVRTTPDRETIQDLQLELETAYLLLQEKALSLVYEPQCGQVRCPDFAVTFTTSLTFMVEVTRLRNIPVQTSFPDEGLADTICSKLSQLQRQHSNILIVGVDGPLFAQTELQSMMLRLQQRAERDPAFWQRYRFRDRADFFNHFQRLSEVLVRGSALQAVEPAIAWVNPQAKFPLAGKVRTALHHSHRCQI